MSNVIRLRKNPMEQIDYEKINFTVIITIRIYISFFVPSEHLIGSPINWAFFHVP